jgi:ketosteroid isomerase-like protein
MKLLHVLRLSAIVLTLVGAANAADPEKSQPNVEQLHSELRKLKSEVEAAMNKGDIEGVLKHAHKDVVLTSLNAGGGRGHAKVREYNDKLMKGPGRTVESVNVTFTPDELSLLYGGDTAISWGSSLGKYKLVGGAEYAINSRWTSTLVRENDRWLIASFHISANLFDNPVLSAVSKTLYWVIGIAALIAVVIGFLIGRRGKR